ncbi:MAG TPA: hypothetical protein VIM51_10955 [Desulfosporosinus sp.]
MGLDKLKETAQRIEAMNAVEGNEVISPRYRRSLGPKFEERHKRITTYLENDLFRKVEALREQGKILSLTSLFNESVKDYLMEKFGK